MSLGNFTWCKIADAIVANVPTDPGKSFKCGNFQKEFTHEIPVEKRVKVWCVIPSRFASTWFKFVFGSPLVHSELSKNEDGADEETTFLAEANSRQSTPFLESVSEYLREWLEAS